MKLDKKELAARTLNVGKGRIMFNIHRLADIQSAITKQDIRDLVKDGSIIVREVKGQKQAKVRQTRRRAGSIRKKVKTGKRDYVIFVRSMRKYLAELLKQEVIDKETYNRLRREIRARSVRTKAHLKERLQVKA